MRGTGENHTMVEEQWMGQVQIGCKVRHKLEQRGIHTEYYNSTHRFSHGFSHFQTEFLYHSPNLSTSICSFQNFPRSLVNSQAALFLCLVP